MPHQWRVQSFSKIKPEATCVAYIDARDVMNRLDEVCQDGWQDDYRDIKGNLFCGIGIKINGEWEWKWDCGEESNIEKKKGEASDSFKRAAVKWGIGRFLYELDIIRVAANEKKGDKNWPYVIDENGKQVWDLTKFINEGKHKNVKTGESKKPDPIKGARTEDDNRPWMSEEQFKKTLARIQSEEIGVYEKADKAMRMKKEYRAQLTEANKKASSQIKN